MLRLRVKPIRHSYRFTLYNNVTYIVWQTNCKPGKDISFLSGLSRFPSSKAHLTHGRATSMWVKEEDLGQVHRVRVREEGVVISPTWTASHWRCHITHWRCHTPPQALTLKCLASPLDKLEKLARVWNTSLTMTPSMGSFEYGIICMPTTMR